jgi:hypothetical protein
MSGKNNDTMIFLGTGVLFVATGFIYGLGTGLKCSKINPINSAAFDTFGKDAKVDRNIVTTSSGEFKAVSSVEFAPDQSGNCAPHTIYLVELYKITATDVTDKRPVVTDPKPTYTKLVCAAAGQ